MSGAATTADVTYRRRATVNGRGWRFRCPDDHADLQWWSRECVRCKSCKESYDPADVDDRKTGQSLEATMSEDSAAKTSIVRSHVEETPGVEQEKTYLSHSDSVLQVILGRYTVNILPDLDESGILVVVSTGEIGTGPSRGRIGFALVASLIAAAPIVRDEIVDHTAAWPLAA